MFFPHLKWGTWDKGLGTTALEYCSGYIFSFCTFARVAQLHRRRCVVVASTLQCHPGDHGQSGLGLNLATERDSKKKGGGGVTLGSQADPV